MLIIPQLKNQPVWKYANWLNLKTVLEVFKERKSIYYR